MWHAVVILLLGTFRKVIPDPPGEGGGFIDLGDNKSKWHFYDRATYTRGCAGWFRKIGKFQKFRRPVG